MKFKSLILGLLITASSAGVYAQSSEIEKAKLEYEKYTSLKQTTPQLANRSLKDAKEAIEKAIIHKKTLNDPAAWSYKGLIYSAMAVNDSSATTNPSLATAVEAIKKAKELDTAGENKKTIDAANDLLYGLQVRKALKTYNQKNYKEAYSEFVKGLDFIPGDTLINYYAASSAQNDKNLPLAIKHYNELLKTNFSFNSDVYANLGEAHAANKDTATAIKVLSEGFAKYPKKQQLFSRSIEFGLAAKQYQDVISKIEAQIANLPSDNKYYPFYLGIAYSELKNAPKAIEAYQKAIAADPNFTEAYMNVGSMLLNSGIDLYNQANHKYANKSLTPAQLADYNAIKKKAFVEFDKALPYLVKATELDPKSKVAWSNLKTYYQGKSNAAKVAEIEAKLKTL